MRQIEYKSFSRRIHQINWRMQRPNLCEFELTFGCGLHCRHCYTDCYNKASYLKKELDTQKIKSILAKVRQAGTVWLCFTGGDPLTRPDFLDLYSYAKNRGFIITIFTSGYSLTEEIAMFFQKEPPFAIELTLNAVREDLFEKISGVSGSFKKVMHGINLILQAGLPLKIKTQVTKDNLSTVPHIKKFVQGLGLRFRSNAFLYARLNGDLMPCDLRISPKDVLSLYGRERRPDRDDKCKIIPIAKKQEVKDTLFPCTIGAGIRIDPYGNTFPCNLIREPRINLLEKTIIQTWNEIRRWMQRKDLNGNKDCRICLIRKSCYSCPGKAWLEKKKIEEKIDWFCELAHLNLIL